jgi:hypothetical protein
MSLDIDLITIVLLNDCLPCLSSPYEVSHVGGSPAPAVGLVLQPATPWQRRPFLFFPNARDSTKDGVPVVDGVCTVLD